MLGLSTSTGARVDAGNGAGLMRFIPNAELEARRQQEQQAAEPPPPILALASDIRTAWDAAVSAKKSNRIEERLLECLRQRKGEYSPTALAQIREFQGSDVFVMLTDNTCRAAKAWLQDIMLPAGEKPWSISPTPVPDLPDHIEARINADSVNAYLQAMQQRAMIARLLRNGEMTR
jgi:hypothetical protein